MSPLPAATPGGPPPGGGGAPGQNLVLTFDNATITGVVSASIAHHYMLDPGVFTIGADEYYRLGEVINTPGPAVKNGVIVTLKNNSKWIVTKTSYLTKLTFEGNGATSAPAGYKVSLSVDGVPKLLKPGTYTGAIVLKVTPLKVFSGTSLAPRVLPATDWPATTHGSDLEKAASPDAAFSLTGGTAHEVETRAWWPLAPHEERCSKSWSCRPAEPPVS